MDTSVKVVFGLFAFGFVAYISGQKNGISLFSIAGVGLALLAVVSWVLSTFIVPYFERREERQLRESLPDSTPEEVEQRRQASLERLSSEHSEKAQQFNTRQAELRQRKLQEAGGDKELGDVLRPKAKISTNVRNAAKDTKPKEDIKEILVEVDPEPAPDSPDITTLSMRMPKGDVHRRRFKLDAPLTQLHAFVESSGYPPSRYAVYNIRPRQTVGVSDEPISTLSPGRGLTLVVEEREDDDEELG